MIKFSELQLAWDNRQHPGSAPCRGYRIEKNRCGEQRFRTIIGPEGEQLTVRRSGIFHVFIEQSGIDSDLDEIMIECYFDDAWSKIKQAAENGYPSLCMLLDNIENNGAAALKGGDCG